MSLTTSAGLKCRDLHAYLKTLSAATLDKLYTHPATCLAVFRELPIISRHYIMRLLFVEQPVPQAVVSSWNEQKYVKDHLEALEALTALHIWMDASLPGGLPGWSLSAVFRKNIQIALLGGGKPWAVYNPLEKDKHGRDASFLDQYAAERWECVLHFMVGCHTTEGISADAVRILLHAGLMKSEEGEGSSPLITMEGFQFLLMDTPSQVWHFVLQYLDTIESRGLNLVECLTFLFQLSFLTLGKDYSTEGMSESLLVFLQHLREFGLVYQRKRRSGRFYPTRLAINLASGLKETSLRSYEAGYIMVETNYRVYAYTNSQLQVALLALFCELLYRFPNLVVARLTRESVRQALRSGITSNQIIKFLRMYAHPEALKRTPVIPATIMDQLRLWELERDRFVFREGVLYSQFISQSDFQLLRNYASDLGVLIWDNPSKRVMVVNRNGHDEVKRFWKRHRQDH
ncbi:general transcription factor IIH subunit 4 marionette [Amblyomma americanum]